jgi:serine/threonine-protein kinase
MPAPRDDTEPGGPDETGGATRISDRHATIGSHEPPPAPAAGQRFVILRPHAAGGLGKVSVARDAELNREVALKELHDKHADDANSRARFNQEAEITGGLEHPGIVPIYGFGQYPDGRPYYAMRFIRGTSMADAIERFHLKARSDPRWTSAATVRQLRRLLGRLIDACNAIEYAHSRGVLHRDIKPANIMLGQYGETLVVDWGLAKALGEPGVDPFLVGSDLAQEMFPEAVLRPLSGSHSAPTQMGSTMGTPQYMSPEQAAGRIDELGPASDVFSLGATLYTILVGQSPHPDDDLGVVLQRARCAEFTPPRALVSAVPRGLEAICLRAMSLRPKDRYASARLLADDVEAWLADEPVKARREPWTTRSWRWVRKHRTLVTGAAGVLVAALVVASIAVWRLDAAADRERRAKNDAIEARNAAEAARAEAERQSARNQELLALARGSLERYEALSQSDALKAYGLETVRSDLQEAALDYYATLAAQAGESEQDRADRASALERMGSTYWQLGRFDDAQRALGESLEHYRELIRQHPRNRAYRRGAAGALSALGELLTDNQQGAAAEEPLAEALAAWQRLHEADRDHVEDRLALAYAHSVEGERLRQIGRVADAAEAMQSGIALLAGADAAGLDDAQQRNIQFRHARALVQLATLEAHALWRLDDARTRLAEARRIMEELSAAEGSPGDADFTLAQILRNLAAIAVRENAVDDAGDLLRQAVESLTRVEQRYPDVPHYRQEMAEALHALGTLQRATREAPASGEALEQLEEAAAIGRWLVERYPQQHDRRLALARQLGSLAVAYETRGDAEHAGAHFDEAAALLAELAQQAADNVDQLYTLGVGQVQGAGQLAAAGRHADALVLLDDAEQTFARLIALAPHFGEAHAALVNLHLARLTSLEADGRLADALAEFDRLIARCNELAAVADQPWMRDLARSVDRAARAGRDELAERIETQEWPTPPEQGGESEP